VILMDYVTFLSEVKCFVMYMSCVDYLWLLLIQLLRKRAEGDSEPDAQSGLCKT